MDTSDFTALTDRARRLATGGGRRILGIAGAPGAGKSTLAARIVERLEGNAVLVPMDGFHLAGAELERLGRAGRKGAPDTFDAAGYAALLRRCATPKARTRCTRPPSTARWRSRSPDPCASPPTSPSS